MLRSIIIVISLSFTFTLNAQRYYQDMDRDGFGSVNVFLDTMLTSPPNGFVADSTDCNDLDNSIFPGAPESCDNIDQDCDGALNNDLVRYNALSG